MKLHKFTWEGFRLVQVETQPHHIAGVLSKIREALKSSNCQWDDVYSAHYESEEDGTTTFYEAESAGAGQPGVWTYVVYGCDLGKEEVVTNRDIDTLHPALKLRRIVAEVIAATNVSSPTEPVQKLRDIAIGHLYLLEPVENHLAGIPILSRTRGGGCAPATAHP